MSTRNNSTHKKQQKRQHQNDVDALLTEAEERLREAENPIEVRNIMEDVKARAEKMYDPKKQASLLATLKRAIDSLSGSKLLTFL